MRLDKYCVLMWLAGQTLRKSKKGEFSENSSRYNCIINQLIGVGHSSLKSGTWNIKTDVIHKFKVDH